MLLGRKLAAHELQKKQEKEEEEEKEKLILQKARELDVFYQQKHGAVPQYSDRNQSRDKHGFHGANGVNVTSYEEYGGPIFLSQNYPFSFLNFPSIDLGV